MVTGRKLRACKVVVRSHASINFEGAKPKSLVKKADLPQRIMPYI